MMETFWEDAEMIASYSRAQAIDDGVLVDLRADPERNKLVNEAGIRLPLACTARVWSECIAMTPAAGKVANTVEGRLWDVLWMFSTAAKGARAADRCAFKLYVVRDKAKPTLTTLHAHIGPGDDGAPVLTFMFPEED